MSKNKSREMNAMFAQLTAQEVAVELYYDDLYYFRHDNPQFRLADMNSRDREKMLDAFVEKNDIKGGWVWAYCMPGCLPDSDFYGPFETREEAEAGAQETHDERDWPLEDADVVVVDEYGDIKE